MSIKSNTEPFDAKGHLLSPLIKNNRLKNLDPNTVRIGLIDPNIAQTWAERVLSDGTTVMSIKKGDTINHTTSQPIATGLFCQRIFGPCTDYTCACGHEKIRIHLNVNVSNPVCPECHVEWTESSVRRQRLGSISLLSPVTHKWFSESRNYIPILTGMTVKTFRTLKECKLFFPFPLQKEYAASSSTDFRNELLFPKEQSGYSKFLSSRKVLYPLNKGVRKRKNTVPYSFLKTKLFYGKKFLTANKNFLYPIRTPKKSLTSDAFRLNPLGLKRADQNGKILTPFSQKQEQSQSPKFKEVQGSVNKTPLPFATTAFFASFGVGSKALASKSTSPRTKFIGEAKKTHLRATKNLQFLLENNGNKPLNFNGLSQIPSALKKQEFRLLPPSLKLEKKKSNSDGSETYTSTTETFLEQTFHKNSFIKKVSKEKGQLLNQSNNYNLTYKKILKQNIKIRLFNYLNNGCFNIKEILLKWSIVLSGSSSQSTKDYNSFGYEKHSFAFGTPLNPSFTFTPKNQEAKELRDFSGSENNDLFLPAQGLQDLALSKTSGTFAGTSTPGLKEEFWREKGLYQQQQKSLSKERKNEFTLNENFLSFLSQKGKFVNRKVEFLGFLHKKNHNFYHSIATAEILKQSYFPNKLTPAFAKANPETVPLVFKALGEKLLSGSLSGGVKGYTALTKKALKTTEKEKFQDFIDQNILKSPLSLLVSNQFHFNSFLIIKESLKLNYFSLNLEIVGWKLKERLRFAKKLKTESSLAFTTTKKKEIEFWYKNNSQKLKYLLSKDLLKKPLPFVTSMSQKRVIHNFYYNSTDSLKKHVLNNFSCLNTKSEKVEFGTLFSRWVNPHNSKNFPLNRLKTEDSCGAGNVISHMKEQTNKDQSNNWSIEKSAETLWSQQNPQSLDQNRTNNSYGLRPNPNSIKEVQKKNKRQVALRSKTYSFFLDKKGFILERYSPKKWSKVVLNRKKSFWVSFNSKVFDSKALTIAKLKCKLAKTQGLISNYNPLLVSSSVELEKVLATSFSFHRKRLSQKSLTTIEMPYSKISESQTLWLEKRPNNQNDHFFPSLNEKKENENGYNSTPIRPSFTQPEDYRRQFLKFIGNHGLIQSVDIPINQSTDHKIPFFAEIINTSQNLSKALQKQKKQNQNLKNTSVAETRKNNYKWHATEGPSSLAWTQELHGTNQKLSSKEWSKGLSVKKQDQRPVSNKIKSSTVQKNKGVKELYFSESKWIAKEEKVKKILSQTGGGGLQNYLGLLNLGQLVFILQNDLFEIGPRLTRSQSARRILLQIVNETYNNLHGLTILLEKVKTKTQKKRREINDKGLDLGQNSGQELSFLSTLIKETNKDQNLIKSNFITELALLWFKQSKINDLSSSITFAPILTPSTKEIAEKNAPVNKTKDKDFGPITPSPLFVAPFSDYGETLATLQRQEELASSSFKPEDFSEQIYKLKLFITVKIESLEKKYKEVKKEYKTVKKICTDFQNRKNAHKRRYKLALQLFRTTSNPAGMTLSSIPVLPPGLRPIIDVPKIGPITADLNIRYRGLIFALRNLRELAYVDFRNAGAAQASVQEAVDDLLYTGGKTRKDKGVGLSPPNLYKSLAMRLKGKHGRFRGNLLGKRVDYSGRSVIVVGPTLKIHQCGLPFEIAVKLFNPFLIRRLIQKGLCKNVYKAKQILIGGKFKPVIWALCREVMLEHLVLLNRAPTLHRLGVQAFIPILVSGRAILLHPLVCTGFNADFDGDQMGVHVPLFPKARAEAWKMMWSRNNFLSPSSGEPILLPSQDMVLGCYYLTEMYSDKFQYSTTKTIKEEVDGPFQSSINTKSYAPNVLNFPKIRSQKRFSNVSTQFAINTNQRDLGFNLRIRKTSSKLALVTISKRLFPVPLSQSLQNTTSFLKGNSFIFIREPYYQIKTNTVLPKKSSLSKALIVRIPGTNIKTKTFSSLKKSETTVAFIDPWAFIAKPLTKAFIATLSTLSSADNLSLDSSSPFAYTQLIGSFWPLVNQSRFLNWTGSASLAPSMKLLKIRGFGTFYQKHILPGNVVGKMDSFPEEVSLSAMTGSAFFRKPFEPGKKAFGISFTDPTSLDKPYSTQSIMPPLQNMSREEIEKTLSSTKQTPILSVKMVLDKYYRGLFTLQSIVWVHLSFKKDLANNYFPKERNNIANKLENEGPITPTLELRINPYGLTQLLQISGSKKSVFDSSFLFPTKKIVKTPFEMSSIRTTVGRLLFNDILQKFEISLNSTSF